MVQHVTGIREGVRTMKSAILARQLIVFLAVALFFAAAAHAGSLRAGAGKAEITPPASALPNVQDIGVPGTAGVGSYISVHDKLWARALVLDDGATTAAIVALDLEKVPRPEEIQRRIAQATGMVPERIMISAVHTHDEPMTEPHDGEGTPRWDAYFETIANGAVKAVSDAKKSFQPARMGYGLGSAAINVNSSGQPDLPTDKTVTVLKFETPSGDPIGLLMNYPLESSAAFRVNTIKDGWEISGDIAGMTEDLVEKHFHGKAVALYTMAAAASLNPEYTGRYTDPETGKTADLGAATWTLVEAQARRLATEVDRVADSTKATEPPARIWAGERPVTCAGLKNSGATGAADYKREVLPPVDLHFGLIIVGDVAIAGAGVELSAHLGQLIRSESAIAKTILVTQANGALGYLMQPDSYERFNHSVQGTKIDPACAEQGLVKNIGEITRRYLEGK